jgi:hypothetical protein
MIHKKVIIEIAKIISNAEMEDAERVHLANEIADVLAGENIHFQRRLFINHAMGKEAGK